MSEGHRKIIHIDMDAFFASVEELEDPSLKRRPLIIGGKPGGRGVVSTCNYEARKYGIHSAMPTSRAVQLCPEAVFVKPNMNKYRKVSEQIHEIIKNHGDLYEYVGVDEAYIDVTTLCRENNLFASDVAKKIRQEIFDQTGLTASAGVAPNRMVAKIASDFNKPNGQTVIAPEFVAEFMKNLKLSKIPGIGPVTTKKLANKGLIYCKDILLLNEKKRPIILGKNHEWYTRKSLGSCEKVIGNRGSRKSLGAERTFFNDITSSSEKIAEIAKLIEKTFRGLDKKNMFAKTLTLKIRYSNFETITRSKTIKEGFSSDEVAFDVATKLLENSDALNRPVRLLGLSFSNLDFRS